MRKIPVNTKMFLLYSSISQYKEPRETIRFVGKLEKRGISVKIKNYPENGHDFNYGGVPDDIAEFINKIY